MVRENEVREALICPSRAGDGDDASTKASRSLRIAVDCRRAELKRTFCVCCEFHFALGMSDGQQTMVATDVGFRCCRA